MQYPRSKQKLIALAVASTCAATALPAWAQDVAQAQGADLSSSQPVQSVVVTGIRASMQSSLNLKRNSDGIVDGIVAEDIGKFPDTNLAESLQRISGVSIDRSIGEGSKVTVRGVGPDFNMVLLNGRQMPTSNLGDLNGRAFDFANLASEAVSQIQVYKTSRAETPAGGIGATLNVMTARPLDRPGTLASIGVKGVYDKSASNLPGDVKDGKRVTPEISGIYSTTWNDNMFGVSVSASYQERNLGYSTASVGNGWKGPYLGSATGGGTIPQPGAPGSENITNRPGASDVYSLPQNLNYAFNGVQRERTNGQLTFQFAPRKDLTTTLDYTYSQNKIHTRRQDLSAWFNFGPSASSWTDGPAAGPLVYTEFLPAGTGDIAMGGADFATVSENKSVGFNTLWKVNSALRLELDVHRSTAESQADSPWGSDNVIGTASFSRGDTTADFSQDFPVLSIAGADFGRAPQQVTGSAFRNGYMKGEISQAQFKGRLKVMESSQLNFGLSATKVDNRSAFSTMQRDTWGGASSPADYPSSVWHPATVRGYFDKIDGSGNPNLFNNFYTFDFGQVRDLAIKASGRPDLYSIKDRWDTDQRTEEKSKALYLQFNTDWDTALPIHTAIGLRYEKTEVVSSALVQTATGISWVSQNEFPVQFGAPDFTTLTGKYNNLLPSIDTDIELREDMKLRLSYGETIGRPRYDQIQGGTVLTALARVDGGTGTSGNPGLKPVESKNLDLSYEWYYGRQNFFALGFFKKNLDNYAGVSQVNATPFNLHTPVGGALWNLALANGCATADTTCIRNYIFRNHPTAPGVTRGNDDASGNATGTIVGQPGDPVANFRITSFSNQKKASLKGFEVNVQHMFGDSGFGVSANYTYVDSGLGFDNASAGEQFALVGLSDSANLVGIYENDKWNVRAAFNWRDKFLASTFDGAGPNPVYTEAYGQFDLSVGYAITPQLSMQFEGINLTNETTRQHGRNERMLVNATQAGARYMLGLRYKF
ncbi:TonB-dependent receptor [Pseudoduganella umbonata]|uniref:TonB-dependent receptor n=1 Tax=Pseudoduganella umbonata TaxID=864828 RepID=A0A4P8HRT8_9BURK|nr:TonB-dependent receptor [Pseudoduganella umbonata]MBB3222331.1 TonB-dependent receptor [Pseudoduganella umbonata]QCP12547.1 TonB-dependent receptor [Pseudoduganella umbonata]